MLVARFIASSLVATYALAACSPDASETLPAGIAATPREAHVSHARSITLPVRLTITIPKRRNGERHHYVSPATQSIAIAITSDGSSFSQTYNQDLTPARNPKCTASLISPTICIVTLSLAPGRYHGDFTTYDGLLDGSGKPTGNALSANQRAPFTVLTGANNGINVTLGGVPTAAIFIPSDTTLSANGSGGYTYSKCVESAKVQVLGRDADGNFILGPGAPVPSLEQTSGKAFTIATPAPSSPSTFTLSPNPGSIGDGKLTARVTPVAETGGNEQHLVIDVTFSQGICAKTFRRGFPNTVEIANIVTGPDGNLWYTDNAFGTGGVGTMTPSGAVTEFTKGFAPNSRPWDIATGPDGALWVTGSEIDRVTTAGVVTRPNSRATFPLTIVAGPDGNMWYTVQDPHIGVASITTSGVLTKYPDPAWTSTGDAPWGIAAGSDGKLWVTLPRSSRVCKISTAGSVTCYSPAFAAGVTASPRAIVSGPDGNLWAVEYGAGAIAKISTDGVLLAEYPTNISGSGNVDYQGLTFGPDGNLWFNASHRTYMMSQSGVMYQASHDNGSSATSIGITAGPGGYVWVAEGTAIARLY